MAKSTNDERSPFDLPPGDILGRMIQLRDWHAAIAEVTSRLEAADTTERRGFYHLFLATLYKLVARSARRREDEAMNSIYRDKAESAYEESLAQDPLNITARLSCADFHLRHRKDAEKALPFLEPFGDSDVSKILSMTQQEHRRLAMRGAAFATLGDIEEARAALEEAYGSSEFQKLLPYSYNTPFWTMMSNKVKLPASVLEPILEHLKQFENHKPRNIEKFREKLTDR